MSDTTSTPAPEVAPAAPAAPVVTPAPVAAATTPVAVGFLTGIWNRVKAIAVEIETKAKFVWGVIWSKLEALDTAANSFITSLGTVKAGLVILAGWIAYFLIAKGILVISASILALLIQSIPYLVGLALICATVLEVANIITKK